MAAWRLARLFLTLSAVMRASLASAQHSCMIPERELNSCARCGGEEGGGVRGEGREVEEKEEELEERVGKWRRGRMRS